MLHPYEVLSPEYAHLLATAKVTRPEKVRQAVAHIRKNLPRYMDAQKADGVPAVLVAALDYRESDCNPNAGFGQGDDWHYVSRHVPAGCGPFTSWLSAYKFYSHYDKLAVHAYPWTMPYLAWKGEGWNGFGPRNHGRYTGYLWAGMDVYDPPSMGGHGLAGKYVADGKWNPDWIDVQLGIIPVMLELIAELPDLGLPNIVAPPIVPPLPDPVPVGLQNAAWVQSALNKLGADPQLDVDNSYGRRTRWAVRQFQAAHGLDADGLAGPLTVEALKIALAAGR